MDASVAQVRLIVYGRQSMNSQKSIDQQWNEQIADAEQQGWTVVGTFSDGVSASRHAKRQRDEWPKVLDAIRAGSVDAVSLWETSRGDRDNTRWNQFLDLCRATGTKVRIVTHGRTYDLTVARDWRNLAEDGVDNAYESEKISMRVRRDMRASAQAGKPHGRLLYGYERRYEPGPRGPRLVAQGIAEDQAAIVREAVRRVLAGDSCYAIAGDFNDRRIPAPSGGQWDGTQVKRLCINPSYAGLRTHQGQIVGAADWPAIIDQDDWQRCTSTLTDPSRARRATTTKYLLTGIAQCGLCDGPLYFVGKGAEPAVQCFQRGCMRITARMAPVDDLVTAVALARMAQPDFVELMAEVNASKAQSAQDSRTHIQALRERLDGFYAAAAAGTITPGALGAIEKPLLDQIADAQAAARVAVLPEVLRDVAGPDAAAKWNRLDINRRRTIIRALMTIHIDPTIKGARKFRPERVRIAWK